VSGIMKRLGESPKPEWICPVLPVVKILASVEYTLRNC
jgi:hypothetical protein